MARDPADRQRENRLWSMSSEAAVAWVFYPFLFHVESLSSLSSRRSIIFEFLSNFFIFKNIWDTTNKKKSNLGFNNFKKKFPEVGSKVIKVQKYFSWLLRLEIKIFEKIILGLKSWKKRNNLQRKWKGREVSYDPQIFEFLFLIFSITCKKL